MARKFVTTKERTFIENINKELLQKVVGQEVVYYAISREHTVAHELYRESVDKVWFSPVRVNARVSFDNTGVDSTMFTLDSKYNLSVMFLNKELEERNLKPRDGDFIEYGKIVYEITSVTRPQLIFGQTQMNIMTKCTCVPSREGQMQVHGNASRFIDNTHPIEDSACSTGDLNEVPSATQNSVEQNFSFVVPNDGDNFTVTIPIAMTDESYTVEVNFSTIPDGGNTALPIPLNAGRTTTTFVLAFSGVIMRNTVLDIYVRDRV